jgi:hypothetical protein
LAPGVAARASRQRSSFRPCKTTSWPWSELGRHQWADRQTALHPRCAPRSSAVSGRSTRPLRQHPGSSARPHDSGRSNAMRGLGKTFDKHGNSSRSSGVAMPLALKKSSHCRMRRALDAALSPFDRMDKLARVHTRLPEQIMLDAALVAERLQHEGGDDVDGLPQTSQANIVVCHPRARAASRSRLRAGPLTT